jgi:serine/threonine-protein kinase RsbW
VKEELRRRISACQEAIESFCVEFKKWLGDQVTPRDAFAGELLLREALVNAVEHGCQRNRLAQVECVVRGGPGRLLIAVLDPGPGFDWRSRWDTNPDLFACSGRGVLIFRTYASRVRFNRAGNAVMLYRRLEKKNRKEMRD